MENPLYTSSVLETLFGLLTVDDLKTCRYVCHLWKTEAFRALRKTSRVNLDSSSKQSLFLKSPEALLYTKFSFSFYNWNQEVSSYLLQIEPSKLEVKCSLILNKEDKGVSVQNFGNLLRTQYKSLVKIVVSVDWAGTLRLVVPQNLLGLKYPRLNSVSIISDQLEAPWLQPLWISIIQNSPKLECLQLKNIVDDDMLKSVCTLETFQRLQELEYVSKRNSEVLGMHERLLADRLPGALLRRLRVPFTENNNNDSIVTRLLSKVADRLEVLEFFTQDETALSPIDFPVMPKLKVLDAGNSQFSFPTIAPSKLPKLQEIRATYWDWVYTMEDLPDVHYYWTTDDPHPGVTDIHLRFPHWPAMDINYRRLENFSDFAEVLKAKFPNACRFYFHNVPIANDFRRALENFTDVFEFTMKELIISSYSSNEVVEASPVEIGVTEHSSQPRELQVFDLGTKFWPGIWNRHPVLSSIREEWLPVLAHFNQLRCIKLLWAKGIFSALQLTNLEVLPHLALLEFVGDKCIDRFDRADVRRKRPLLKLIQHRKCYCEEEDWWYMSDPKSDQIFHDFFTTKGSFLRMPKVLTKITFGLLG